MQSIPSLQRARAIQNQNTHQLPHTPRGLAGGPDGEAAWGGSMARPADRRIGTCWRGRASRTSDARSYPMHPEDLAGGPDGGAAREAADQLGQVVAVLHQHFATPAARRTILRFGSWHRCGGPSLQP